MNLPLLEAEISSYLGVDVELLTLLLQVTLLCGAMVGAFLLRRRAIDGIRKRNQRPLDAQRSFRMWTLICAMGAIVMMVALQFWSNYEAAAI